MSSENHLDLSAADIRRLFVRLDEVLGSRGQKATLYLVGGANISLAINSQRTTTDIDSVVREGYDVIFDAAREVARSEPGLGEDWLNDNLTGGQPNGGLAWPFMDQADSDEPALLMQGSSLLVELASPEMMLALKTLARQDRDLDDTYALMRRTGIRSADELRVNLERFSGPRLFQQQGAAWMPHHIDPNFRFILDNAPDDLRPPARTQRAGIWARLRRKTR